MELMLQLMLRETSPNLHLQLSPSQRIIASPTPTTSPNRPRRSSLLVPVFQKLASLMRAARMTRNGPMPSL
jgi:hypothetical protein